ncbi:TlpA disulfide reductase family protein [Halopenitus sp. POP-27]|uniref:TlpA family protein disulfide reductase n=1 Tax=Halopenitus sp. POP-27 TaxID=2994425 RepID=UPI0024682C3A|nr:TlpA disulfide reductase family protein [Halopenitus sp. POP-27]
MRRRQVLAGVASAATIGGAGLVATGGVPTVLGGTDVEPVDPVTLPTIDAPGSEDGEVTIPATDRPTFVDFFATWCGPCEEQMPILADVRPQVSDRVQFVSVTPEDASQDGVRRTIADWWRDHDGDWLVASDVVAELTSTLNVGGYPTAVAIDDTGRIRWSDSGVHTAEELLDGIDRAL